MRRYVLRSAAALLMAAAISSVAADEAGEAAEATEAEKKEEAPAKTEPALDGAKLWMTKTCIACHGVDGNTPLLPNYPKLAGQNAAYSLQQMIDIKSGARTNAQTAAMKGIIHLVNEEEMKALAEYIEVMIRK